MKMNITKSSSRSSLLTAKHKLLPVFAALIGGVAFQAHGQSMINATKDYPMEIVECTKNEQMAVGSDKNVLRWRKNTTKFNGTWYMRAAGNHKVNIIHKPTGLYLNVNSVTGNVTVEPARPDSKEQLFRFQTLSLDQAQKFLPAATYKENISRDGGGVRFVYIIESTRNERVAVGSNGNILRWGELNDQTQIFCCWFPTA